MTDRALDEIAARRSLPRHLARPHSSPAALHLSSAPHEETAAESLLAQVRNEKEVQKASRSSSVFGKLSTGRRTSGGGKKGAWSQNEASAALRLAVGGKYPPGVVLALLERGASVSVLRGRTHSALKKLQKKDTEDVRSDVLAMAAGLGDAELVGLLAGHATADEEAKVEALKAAAQRNNVEAAECLLQHGTSADSLAGELRQAIQSGWNALAELLLKPPFPVSTQHTTEALKLAITRGAADQVAMLVSYGAVASDCETDFLIAVQKGRTDLVLLMVLTPAKPYSTTLARGVHVAFQNPARLSREGRAELMRILLLAGAGGEGVAAALVAAVEARDLEMAKMLIEFGADIQYQSSSALQIAVGRLDLDMIAAVYDSNRGINPEDSEAVLSKLPYSRNAAGIAKDITSAFRMLLDLGATGDPIHEAVVQMVEAKNLDALRILLRHDASLDYLSGAALKLCVQTEDPEMLHFLLRNGSPSKETRSSTFAFLFKSARPNRARMKLATLLLDSEVNEKAVEEALVGVLRDEVMVRDLAIVELLSTSVEHKTTGADEFLELAVSQGRIVVVEMMVSKAPPPTKGQLAKAVTVCMEHSNFEVRYEILKLLLQAGADGEEVTIEFLKALDGNDSGSLNFAHLFLDAGSPGPDVNYGNGKALLLAMAIPDCGLLRRLMKRSPSKHAVANSIKKLGTTKLPTAQKIELFHELFQGKKSVSANTEALLSILQNHDSSSAQHFDELVREVLRAGIYLDKNGGEKILALAVKSKDKQVISLVLSQSPSAASAMKLALVELSKVTDVAKLVPIMTLLVRRVEDPSWDEFSNELVRAVGFGQRGLPYTQLLLTAGASVDYQQGTPLRLSIDSACVEQVKLCLQHNPNLSTLDVGFKAAWSLDKVSFQLTILEALLLTASKLGFIPHLYDTLASSLTRAVEMGEMGTELMKLFLKHGSTPDGATFSTAVRVGNVSGLQLLLTARTPLGSLEEAMDVVPEIRHPDVRFRIVEVLLGAGLHGPKVDDALVRALEERPANFKLVRLLIPHASPAALDAALEKIMSTPTLWAASEVPSTVTALLQAGAASAPQNLLRTVEELLLTPNSAHIRSLLTVLADNNAGDVNFREGVALEMAVLNMREDLVRLMLKLKPSPETVAAALPSLFDLEGEGSVEATRRILEMFCGEGVPRPKGVRDYDSPGAKVLFLCMGKFPAATDLLERLLGLGYEAEQVKVERIGEEGVEEECNALIWALAKGIPDASVLELINHGANINYSTLSGLTPISLSVSSNRSKITSILIERGANVNITHNNASILHAASLNGDVSTIKTLISKGADVDDGSLHSAAAMLYIDAAQVLLAAGHDPDYPSALHEGRSALMEMCYSCQGRGRGGQIKAMIRLLLNSNTDLELQVDGKSLLFWALDNPQGYEVVDALLSVTYRKLDINRPSNICIANGYAYSPLDYVSRGISSIPDASRPPLIALLKRYRCQPRFYRLTSEQPPDATGLPPHLQAEHEERQAVHRRVSLARYESEALRAEEEKKHQQSLLFSSNAHALRLAQMREQTAVHNEGLGETHQLRLEHAKMEAVQSNTIEAHRREGELEHGRNMAQQRLGFIDEEQRKLLEYKLQFDGAEQSALEKRLVAARRHEEYMTGKQLEYVNAQKGLVADQGRLAQMAIGYAERGQHMRSQAAGLDNRGARYENAAKFIMPAMPPDPGSPRQGRRVSEVPD